MCKKSLFLSLFLEKRGQIRKKSRKSWCGHQLRTMTYFSKYHTFDPLLYLGCQMLWTLFFFYFFCENRSNNKIFGKKNLRASTRTHDPFFDNSKIWPTFIHRGEVPADTFAKLPVHVLINHPKKNWYRHQLQPILHFLTNHKFDLLSYFYIINFLNPPLRALIHDLQKKNLRASTRTHDPFFDNSEIWPTFIYRGEVPAHTFAKLPVCVLINDPKKMIQTSTTTHAPFFDEPQIWPTFIFLYHQFFKSSSPCSNSWPTKKNLQASTRTHDPFFDNPKFDLLLYIGEKCLRTHLQSFLCAS